MLRMMTRSLILDRKRDYANPGHFYGKRCQYLELILCSFSLEISILVQKVTPNSGQLDRLNFASRFNSPWNETDLCTTRKDLWGFTWHGFSGISGLTFLQKKRHFLEPRIFLARQTPLIPSYKANPLGSPTNQKGTSNLNSF